jgi:hypothetical protein
MLNPNTASTTQFRLLQAVRVVQVRVTTAIAATLQWKSNYGPDAQTLVTGTSSTAGGFVTQTPPRTSLASFWSTTGISESEVVMGLKFTTADYIDVWYQAVLGDSLLVSTVTTTNVGIAGQIYRSYLDGPSASALLVPVGVIGLN